VQKGTIKQNRSCKSTLTAPQKMMTPLTSSKVIRHANAQVIAQQWELSCGGAVWAALKAALAAISPAMVTTSRMRVTPKLSGGGS
jgi:hypothetical protein